MPLPSEFPPCRAAFVQQQCRPFAAIPLCSAADLAPTRPSGVAVFRSARPSLWRCQIIAGKPLSMEGFGREAVLAAWCAETHPAIAATGIFDSDSRNHGSRPHLATAKLLPRILEIHTYPAVSTTARLLGGPSHADPLRCRGSGRWARACARDVSSEKPLGTRLAQILEMQAECGRSLENTGRHPQEAPGWRWPKLPRSSEGLIKFGGVRICRRWANSRSVAASSTGVGPTFAEVGPEWTTSGRGLPISARNQPIRHGGMKMLRNWHRAI